MEGYIEHKQLNLQILCSLYWLALRIEGWTGVV